MSEKLTITPEFEQLPNREIEKKYLPVSPDILNRFRHEARPIEQLYLSHPDEPFSLRLRETLASDGSLTYEATLKDRGSYGPDGLNRLEINTLISPETYEYYKQDTLPSLKKLRAEPHKHIAIDFFEDGHVHVEAEDPIAWSYFLEQQGFRDHQFYEIRGDSVDNEWRAHFGHRQAYGAEAIVEPRPPIDELIILEKLSKHHEDTDVVAIVGRSGSGKTTLINTLQYKLEEYGISHAVLSTDDYHRGKAWLDVRNNGEAWSKWDDAVVYDTRALAMDIESLKSGQTIDKRHFNFFTQEPEIVGIVKPANVIIVEGLYAQSADLTAEITQLYEQPTPLATCIGRRLLRDIHERPQFSDLSASLRYTLEQAEPAYRNQSVGG